MLYGLLCYACFNRFSGTKFGCTCDIHRKKVLSLLRLLFGFQGLERPYQNRTKFVWLYGKRHPSLWVHRLWYIPAVVVKDEVFCVDFPNFVVYSHCATSCAASCTPFYLRCLEERSKCLELDMIRNSNYCILTTS